MKVKTLSKSRSGRGPSRPVSMRRGSPRPITAAEPAPSLRSSSARGAPEPWIGLPAIPSGGVIRRCCGPKCARSWCWARTTHRRKIQWRRSARDLSEQYGIDVKIFVDTAPVMEKPAAMRAGLGWQGKHTNLVSREFGSWLFLAEVFLALELPADEPESDHCGSCA